jgi:DNA-binding IclR family transcriptional regulator
VTDPDHQLPFHALLARAHARFVGECEQRLTQAGYPDLAVAHGANVLRFLSLDRAVPVAEVVRRSGVSKQAISQQVRHLAEHGYLTVEAEKTDGRAKALRFTARGARSKQVAIRITADVEREWAERHGEPTIANLRSGLELVVGAAR